MALELPQAPETRNVRWEVWAEAALLQTCLLSKQEANRLCSSGREVLTAALHAQPFSMTTRLVLFLRILTVSCHSTVKSSEHLNVFSV